jgi:hypothetical protein
VNLGQVAQGKVFGQVSFQFGLKEAGTRIIIQDSTDMEEGVTWRPSEKMQVNQTKSSGGVRRANRTSHHSAKWWEIGASG